MVFIILCHLEGNLIMRFSKKPMALWVRSRFETILLTFLINPAANKCIRMNDFGMHNSFFIEPSTLVFMFAASANSFLLTLYREAYYPHTNASTNKLWPALLKCIIVLSFISSLSDRVFLILFQGLSTRLKIKTK